MNGIVPSRRKKGLGEAPISPVIRGLALLKTHLERCYITTRDLHAARRCLRGEKRLFARGETRETKKTSLGHTDLIGELTKSY